MSDFGCDQRDITNGVVNQSGAYRRDRSECRTRYCWSNTSGAGRKRDESARCWRDFSPTARDIICLPICGLGATTESSFNRPTIGHQPKNSHSHFGVLPKARAIASGSVVEVQVPRPRMASALAPKHSGDASVTSEGQQSDGRNHPSLRLETPRSAATLINV